MRKFTTITLLSLLSLSVSSAAIIYDNGTFNSLGGNGMGDAIQAEDFVLASATDLTSVRFWSLEAPGAYLGSITWSILTNVAGLPGVSIASGSAAPTQTNVGTAFGLTIFQNDFAISVPGLAAGTYWLSLHDGPNSATDFQDFYWAWTNLNATNSTSNRGVEMALPGGTTWDTNDQEHAFLIMGDAAVDPIPEPGTNLLISFGLAALVIARRYTKR